MVGKTTSFEDRRSTVRTADNSVLELKIVFASDTPGLLGKNLSGSTVDVSMSGLGISLDCPVPVDSTLDVWVTLRSDFKKYFLSGKVCWCRPSEEKGMHLVGIALHERTDSKTDLKDWKIEIHSRQTQ